MKPLRRQFLIFIGVSGLICLQPFSSWPVSNKLPQQPAAHRLARDQASDLLVQLSQFDLSEMVYLGLQYEFRMQSDWHAGCDL